MAISRMQQPRQQYGLGSLVKKAVRGVKKIVKSPLGKAAILGGLGMWGMGAGPFSGLKGAGWLKSLGAKSMMNMGPLRGTAAGKGWLGKMAGGVGNWWGGLSGGQKLFTGLAGASLAAPFLMKGDEEEEVDEESWTQIPSSIADIRNQARAHYTNPSASTLSFMPGKQFIKENFYAADGGRAGLMNGGEAGQEQIEKMLMAEFVKYKNQGGTLTFEQFVQAVMQQQQEEQMPEGAGMEQPQELAMAANGGRIGYNRGRVVNPGGYAGDDEMGILEWIKSKAGIESETNPTVFGTQDSLLNQGSITQLKNAIKSYEAMMHMGELDEEQLADYELKLAQLQALEEGAETRADGGRIGAYAGGLMSEDEDEYSYDPQAAMRMYKRQGKQEGGIMETEEASEMIDMGGEEKDYRETGGFVEIGGKERADDVPARLSKNEFVFTADAVRNAGGGDIDKGSEVMQNLMDNLEAGGEVSEDSQGLEGAQAMYDQQQMLQSRIA